MEDYDYMLSIGKKKKIITLGIILFISVAISVFLFYRYEVEKNEYRDNYYLNTCMYTTRVRSSIYEILDWTVNEAINGYNNALKECEKIKPTDSKSKDYYSQYNNYQSCTRNANLKNSFKELVESEKYINGSGAIIKSTNNIVSKHYNEVSTSNYRSFRDLTNLINNSYECYIKYYQSILNIDNVDKMYNNGGYEKECIDYINQIEEMINSTNCKDNENVIYYEKVKEK